MRVMLAFKIGLYMHMFVEDFLFFCYIINLLII